MVNMKLLKAISKRCSRRSFLEKEIEDNVKEKLDEIIKVINEVSELNIQLITDDKELFKSFASSYGMLKGVQSYFALVGNKNDDRLLDKIGYYGELLVLEATALGLGTCWIGGTYKKGECIQHIKCSKDKELVAIIPVGYVEDEKTFKEKLIKKVVNRRSKTIDEMYTSEGKVPEEFINGMKAVQFAPSAVNRQPVMFNYKDGVVTAMISDLNVKEEIDLGIAMLHFKIGAMTDSEWEKNGDVFTLDLKIL